MTNTMSRKANEIFKANNVKANAKGCDFTGTIAIKGEIEDAAILLVANGFETAVMHGSLYAIK
jgi:hypothetical protein